MPQGHLNILHPGENLLQLNETLPVSAQETAIVRGSLLVRDSGEWRRSAATDANGGTSSTPGPICYWSLQDQVQPDVGFAKALTAIPCTYPMKLETDQYLSTDNYAVGCFLQAGDGGLLEVFAAEGNTAVGVLTALPGARWSNDRLANTTYGGAQRTGAPVTVIQLWSVYIPCLCQVVPTPTPSR